jgi:DNA-binding response OmpR family regulator
MHPEMPDRYTVLYVEDDAQIRAEVCEFLARCFGNVVQAENAEDAYRIWQEGSIDAMIADLRLPGMSGLELVGKIRLEDETMPIVMLTAYSDTDLLLRAVGLNLTCYLVKPVDPVALKEAIGQIGAKLAKHSRFQLLGRGVQWDPQARQLFCQNSEICLTYKEALLMALLVECRDAWTPSPVLCELFDERFGEMVSDDALRYHIVQLRRKIAPLEILSRRGEGYRLTIP